MSVGREEYVAVKVSSAQQIQKEVSKVLVTLEAQPERKTSACTLLNVFVSNPCMASQLHPLFYVVLGAARVHGTNLLPFPT